MTERSISRYWWEAAPTRATRQVFAHELVHACLANIGSWPAWLHEGLAQKLSGEPVSAGYAGNNQRRW